MASSWPSLFFVIGIIASARSSPQFYSVVAPEIVRPNSVYHVAISIIAALQPCTVHVELSADLDTGGKYNVSKTATVKPGTTGLIKLQIGNTTPGRYKLVAQGLSGIEFLNTTDLQFVLKSHSVFIQTDRAIYKPGNKVFYRVVVLDSKLRPAPNGTELDAYVTDGQGNRVKQWKQQIVNRGVFSAEIQLSDVPVLGDWKIVVNVLDLDVEKHFEVAEYVLPKFEVAITPPTDATFSDSVITVIVTAKYTYGKAVKGKATITAFPNTYGYFDGAYQLHPAVQKVVPIDGSATVTFDISSELGLQSWYDQTVRLEASVEEALTGRSQNASSQMTIYTHKFTIELIKTADSYKPGLKYTAFIKIAHHDGSPVQDELNPVKIWYGFTYNRSLYTNISRMLDDNGMIQLDFDPPLDTNGTSDNLNIEAEYLGLHQYFGGISKAISPSSTYIQAFLQTENPVVNKCVRIKVTSTIPMKYFNYEVMGRGDILIANTVQVASENTATFRFQATYLMAPTARVIVYYIRCDGEVVAAALNIQLNGTLENFVDIGISPQETKPGGSVDLTITSQPNSYVGLLGVDQSSILLKTGNDITHEQVATELSSYTSDSQIGLGSFGSRRFFWNPGSSNAFEVFSESKLVFLSNGFLYQNQQLIFFRFGGFGGGGDVAFAGAADGAMAPRAMAAESDSAVAASPTVQPDTIKVRKDFPETWIWEMVDAGSNGKTVLQRTAPDTITSWMLTAFCVDPIHGFGLIEEPRKLTVFQSFFISLNLPYSVIRGEIVAVSIIVFNYMDKDITADVVLKNDGQFEFAETTNELQNSSTLALVRQKTIEVKASSGSPVSFMIIPKNVGTIIISVTATSALAGDSIDQPLLVKPEGQTQYRNKALFVDLRTAKSFEATVKLDIPNNRVPGSENIDISAVGDILGPGLSNLANLIRMPSGCGEQNMLGLVPNIVVINYLKSRDQLTPEAQGKALSFIEVGYQRELTYRHTDGSFSAFGNSDRSGSTWLTAYVCEWFIQAAAHVTVEQRIINEALQWLARVQAPEGNFPEVGTVIHKDMQGGAAKGLALTAFSLISFFGNETYVSVYKSTVTKGLDYIVKNLKGLDDIYSLCLCTYVLNLAKHPSADTAFEMMQAMAKQSGGLLWWSKPIAQDDTNPWHSMPRSVDVEMTSYAMLSYLLRNMVAECLPIMKWLVTQRNSDGGFASTQDTVMGINSLAELAKRLSSENSSISITFTYEDGGKGSINITSENNMILQKEVLPDKTREVDITAVGNGFAIVQVSYSYNLNETGAFPLFTLRVQVDDNSDANHLQLTICSGFIPTKEANESNMAVMEVNFPSGFVFDTDFLLTLQSTPNVKRVETKNGDTIVVLYFDKMVKEEYCVTINAFRMFKVAKLKPIPVTIYDYYDSSRRATVFYEAPIATLCDICQGEDCGNTCKVG